MTLGDLRSFLKDIDLPDTTEIVLVTEAGREHYVSAEPTIFPAQGKFKNAEVLAFVGE